MRKYTRLCWTSLFMLLLSRAAAQIGAEAQGGKLTYWNALGLDQELSPHITSVTDFGYGRHSDPDDLNLLKRQGLVVFTQDFIYRINQHWRFALSFGYWQRYYYDDSPPYNPLPILNYRNEIRPFQRLYYDHVISRIKFTHTLRFDYRFYWTPGYESRWPTPFEFRTRYMLNIKIPITESGMHQIILNDEILTAIDQYSSFGAAINHAAWTRYVFTENRFSLYYRKKIIKLNADFDIGLMHQYWREVKQEDFTLSYNIMMDLIIYNPFGERRHGNR